VAKGKVYLLKISPQRENNLVMRSWEGNRRTSGRAETQMGSLSRGTGFV